MSNFDDLTIRRATAADAEKIAAFNARIHSDYGPDHPDERVAAWTYDLLAHPHPTFKPEDFIVVEKTATGEVVSTLNLISQTWTYDGIPFGVGRPELVGTLPEYRQRGLVRKQFDMIHQWSAERGELVQAITGIPYYYRIFGYEMALNLSGGRAGYKAHVPRLADGQAEPYRLRPAMPDDIPFMDMLYQQNCQRGPLACQRNEELWRYELLGKSPLNVSRFEDRIIEDAQTGQRVGFVMHTPWSWGNTMPLTFYELAPGISWAAVTPSVIRYIFTTGEKYLSDEKPYPGKPAELTGFYFCLGEGHPAYEVMHFSLPSVRPPYAWYIRVPDLPAFLQCIAPALEKRLALSPLVGHTGEIKITFYKHGVRMAFEQGRLKQIEAWKPTPVGHAGDAGFPGLTFLQLVFGYRSLDELRHAFPDCFQNGDLPYALLNALFPKRPSDLWPIA